MFAKSQLSGTVCPPLAIPFLYPSRVLLDGCSPSITVSSSYCLWAFTLLNDPLGVVFPYLFLLSVVYWRSVINGL